MALTFEQYRELVLQGKTEAEIDAIEAGQQPPEFTASNIARNIFPSAGRLIGDIATAVAHPIQTVKALGKTAVGAVEKAIPGEQPQEEAFDAVIDFYRQRYGSLENLQRTIVEDPVGFLADASLATGIVGKAARVPAITRAATAIDPLAQITRGVGKVAEVATEGRRIGIPRNRPVPAVSEAAERLGVELPASAVTTSPVVPLIEGLEAKSLFGGRVAEVIQNAKTSLNRISDEVVKSIGGSTDASITGKGILRGADNFRDTFIKRKDELYGVFEAEAKTMPAVLDSTESALQEIVTMKRSVIGGAKDVKAFEKKLFETLQAKADFLMTPEGIRPATKFTFENLKQTRSEIGRQLKSRTDPFVTGNKALLEKLYAALSDDMDATAIARHPELRDAIREANQFYREGLEKMNSAYGRKIAQFRNQPDKILPAIISPTTSVEDIPRIFELVGQQNVSSIRATLLQRMFKSARGTNEFFTPAGLTRELNKLGEPKIRAIFEPQQVQAIKDIEIVAKSFARFGRIAEGSQTAFILKIVAPLAALSINWTVLLKLLVGDFAFNKFISSVAGQKFLREGFTLTGETGRRIQRAAPTVGATGRELLQAERVREAVGNRSTSELQ